MKADDDLFERINTNSSHISASQNCSQLQH